MGGGYTGMLQVGVEEEEAGRVAGARPAGPESGPLQSPTERWMGFRVWQLSGDGGGAVRR